MSLNLEDVQIEILARERYKTDITTLKGNFVKATHIPSGIAVTEYHNRSQIKARDAALLELKYLVSIWSREND